jgi:hypothetical protein
MAAGNEAQTQLGEEHAIWLAADGHLSARSPLRYSFSLNRIGELEGQKT